MWRVLSQTFYSYCKRERSGSRRNSVYGGSGPSILVFDLCKLVVLTESMGSLWHVAHATHWTSYIICRSSSKWKCTAPCWRKYSGLQNSNSRALNHEPCLLSRGWPHAREASPTSCWKEKKVFWGATAMSEKYASPALLCSQNNKRSEWLSRHLKYNGERGPTDCTYWYQAFSRKLQEIT